jgi:hypothetical protein
MDSVGPVTVRPPRCTTDDSATHAAEMLHHHVSRTRAQPQQEGTRRHGARHPFERSDGVTGPHPRGPGAGQHPAPHALHHRGFGHTRRRNVAPPRISDPRQPTPGTSPIAPPRIRPHPSPEHCTTAYLGPAPSHDQRERDGMGVRHPFERSGGVTGPHPRGPGASQHPAPSHCTTQGRRHPAPPSQRRPTPSIQRFGRTPAAPSSASLRRIPDATRSASLVRSAFGLNVKYR